jgi:hypothetical protein
MRKYPLDKKLKSFSTDSLYKEIYNRETNEESEKKEKEQDAKLHKIDFPDGTEYFIIEYDALNRKQYQSNKSLALRTLAIIEVHGMNAKIRRGKKNQILIFGESKKFLQIAEWVKLTFLSLECLGNPKLNWIKKCEEVFPKNKAGQK